MDCNYSSHKLIAIFTVSPYDPDSRFTLTSLHKLEGVGISAVTTLKAIYPQLKLSAGIILDKHSQRRLDSQVTNVECFNIIVSEWESGNSRFPPTWRSLLSVLKQLHLEDLSQKIDNYLLGKL